jgi:transposase
VQKIDETVLRRLYLEQHLSFRQISSLLNVTYLVILRNMRDYNIPVREGEAVLIGRRSKTKQLTGERLRELHHAQRLTVAEIATAHDVSARQVQRLINKYELNIGQGRRRSTR